MVKRKGFLSLLLVVVLLLTCNVPVMAASQDKDKNKQDLEKVEFIHYKGKSNPNPAKPRDPGYSLMGVKWNALPVQYIINPTNNCSLGPDQVLAAISTSAEIWDQQTGKELFGNTPVIDYSVYYGQQDYKNVISFGSYPNSGVIAVTSVWFNRKSGSIVEFDMLFNTYYTWGDATVNASSMDLQNIATHELGHAVGLNDIYNSGFSYVTMYGYSYNGDIDKRTLETPDIIGLQQMYGN